MIFIILFVPKTWLQITISVEIIEHNFDRPSNANII